MAGTAAHRHAQAAFKIALERNELNTWRADLERLSSAVNDPLLLTFLENPRVYQKQKLEVLNNVLVGLNPLVLNLASLLVSRERLRLLPDIVADYMRMMDEHEGRAHAGITTAVPLEPEDTEKINRNLSKLIGREIVLSDSVDPSIIGGIRVRIGDKLIDGSTRKKLQALRGSLKR